MKSLRAGMLAVAWGCAALAVRGFAMPWAHLDVHEPAMLKQVRQTAPLQDAMQGLGRGLSRIAVNIKRGTETVTGDIPLGSLDNLPRAITGAQIPQLANSHQAQVALAVMQLLAGASTQELGRQSYAVYLLPGLAVLAAVLLTVVGRRRLVAGAVAIVCSLIAAVGFWKLLTTNTATLFVAITIGQGLWLSLWAYAGLAAAAIGSVLLVVL